jgi:membrane protein DedA with SNARE-associated domain
VDGEHLEFHLTLPSLRVSETLAMLIEWIKYLVIHYGYPAIFVGTFFDSESTVLVLGGIAARLGYLDLSLVMVICYLGVFGGDQFYFSLGRWKGNEVLSRFPRLQRGVATIQKKIRHQKIIKILVFRFLLGLRIPAPLILGMSEVPYGKFVWIDALLLLPWAVGLCFAGYLVGELVKQIMVHVSHYQLLVFGVIAGIIFLIWLISKLYLEE